MTDARTIPAYPLHEAARILRVPASTLRTWFPGRRPAAEGGYFNFLELAEAYLIQVLRSRHQLPMRRITKALTYLRKKTGQPHPLAMTDLGFETDGVQLFINHVGKLVSASENGNLKTLLAALRDQPIFTVGDHEDFLQLGGALRFWHHGDQIAFQIKADALRAAQIKAHPRLLQLSREPPKIR